MIKVLMVDDHDLVRIGIKGLLDRVSDLEVVAEARSGEEAIRLAKKHLPDVVLMDLNMPGIGGLEATRILLRVNPDSKVIVVSVHMDGPFPVRMLEMGVSGYLTKGSPPEEMIKAIRDVHRGKRYVDPHVAQNLVLKRYEGRAAPLESLSPRELEVMVLLTQGHKIQAIADKLCLSPKTISTLRGRVFKKLDARTDVELTHIALRHDLIEPRGDS